MIELDGFINNFLKSEDEDNIFFQNIMEILNKAHVQQNKDIFSVILGVLSAIANNYHRYPYFFQKIEKIILFLVEDIKKNFTNIEVYRYFQNSKRILLFLFQKEIIILDQIILSEISKNTAFFYQEIKPFFDEKKLKQIINSVLKSDPTFFDNYEQKRQLGENDAYICSLIRNDSIDEFIIYVNQKNISLSSKIQRSVFETNIFSFQKQTTLIEYAAFFGSVQIFQYLRMNNVILTPSLWIYAIHSNNPEMIQILEDNHVKPEDETYESIVMESIKCHHNDLADYFINNFFDKQIEDIVKYSFQYFNFRYFPKENNNDYLLLFACQYNYIDIVRQILSIEDLNRDITIV